jgi:hypothetical protein
MSTSICAINHPDFLPSRLPALLDENSIVSQSNISHRIDMSHRRIRYSFIISETRMLSVS